MSVAASKKRLKKDVPVKADTSAATATTPRPSGALTLAKQVAGNLDIWNNWRQNLNPLRGLSIQRAVYLLESYERGIMADYAWTLRFIEKSDADLMALIARRTSALLQMDWTIKVPVKDKRGNPVDTALANAQADALWAAYGQIDNLKAAIRHLALATFRGYAHCEKWQDAAGNVTHLEIVEPWNVVRNGLAAQWKYNPQSLASYYQGLPENLVMAPADFLIRTVDLPVGRIALLKYIRQNLAEKDWDAFVEIYGIPGWVIIGPPNVPPEKEAEYQGAAESIAHGGSGYLPNGSAATASDGPRGNSPFKERMEYLSEKLILAGTGGLLTMLAASGTGTLAGNAHQETFEIIVRGEAAEINEVFQQQLDAVILAQSFPGQPRLAYFEIAANEETDVETFVDAVEKLGRAGYQVDEDQVSEKSGYHVTLKPDPKPVKKRADEDDPLLNKKAPIAGGRWVTIDGNHVFIKSGKGKGAARITHADIRPGDVIVHHSDPTGFGTIVKSKSTVLSRTDKMLHVKPIDEHGTFNWPATKQKLSYVHAVERGGHTYTLEAGGMPVKNRAQTGPDDDDMGEFLANARIALGDALGHDFAPLAEALQTVVDKSDAEMPVALAVLKAHLPTLRKQILNAPATAAAYQNILAPALVDGLAAGADASSEKPTE